MEIPSKAVSQLAPQSASQSFHFISFAAGPMWPNTRIAREAHTSKMFQSVYVGGVGDIINSDLWYPQLQREKGFGYWQWKPYVILQRLRQLPENDILVYTDAGCHVFRSSTEKQALLQRQTWRRYVDIVNEEPTGMFVFCMEEKPLVKWTKKECITALDPNGKIPLNASQCVAGILVIRNCPFARDFLENWSVIMTRRNLIDDSITVKQYEDFVQHRHDQSVLTLLAYTAGLKMIPDETSPFQAAAPFFAARDRSV